MTAQRAVLARKISRGARLSRPRNAASSAAKIAAAEARIADASSAAAAEIEEVAKHNKKEDLWIAVKGVVMNVTDWVDEHPGGPQALFSHMGKDASEEFEMLHDDEVIPKYAAGIVIGRVKGQEITLEY